MLVFLIKSLICTAVLYGLYRIFLKNETYFTGNRVFLVGALVLSVMIPLLNIPLTTLLEEDRTISYFISGVKSILFVNLLDEVVITAPAPNSIDWISVLERTYLAGVLVFSLRLLKFLWEIAALHNKSRRYTVGNIQVYIHTKNYTAFSFLNNIYVNREEFNNKEFKVVWKHELEHIRQGHTIESFLLEIVCCLFWFNPFVWAIKHSLKEIHEYLADKSLVQLGVNIVDYQRYLVNYAFGGNVFATANNFAAISVKNRITMLAKGRSSFRNKLKLIFILPVLLVLLSAFSVVPNGVPKSTSVPVADIEDVVITPLDSLTITPEP